jgi:hypothetical protein
MCNMVRLICELYILKWKSRLNHHSTNMTDAMVQRDATGSTLSLLHATWCINRYESQEENCVKLVPTVQSLIYLYDYTH